MPPYNSAELQASRKEICLVSQFLNFRINKLSDIGLPLSTLRDEPPLTDIDSSYYYKYSLYIKRLKIYANK